MELKIAVYTVALNEEKHVDNWYRMNADADMLIVGDTGSTDKTVLKLDANGCKQDGPIVKTYDIRVLPWRFDVARNTVLSLIPPDIDICIAVDMDEQLVGNWREHLERTWTNVDGHATRMRHRYHWAFLEDGTPSVSFIADRIHARKGYAWHYPCHEQLYWYGQTDEHIYENPDIVIEHHADPSKPRSQYLPLLKVGAEERPESDRMAIYYARELYFHKSWEPAIAELNRYLRLPSARWPEERAAALIYLSRCYSELHMIPLRREYAEQAVAEVPNRAECWLEVATVAYEEESWAHCIDVCNEGMKQPPDTVSYLSDKFVYAKLHDLLAIAYYNLGEYERALDNGMKALAGMPTDERIADNVQWYADKAGLDIASTWGGTRALLEAEFVRKEPSYVTIAHEEVVSYGST